MDFIAKSFRRCCGIGLLKPLIPFLALLLAVLPSGAFAAGGENVVLNFTQSDMIYLYLSLAFGLLAIIFAFILRNGLMKTSPGSEKMQEVGLAIREGALAYLMRQVKTMLIFVILLAIGLGVMYGTQYNNSALGFYIALSFVGGVAASYIAGYAGMLMAVAANMRTANAALTSYKSALEIAFRSGAVAGLVTVGMGLIGATIILMFAASDAMKLLIGFGFGGSLAALFMRVGGGIFTKAADVGADLVGKVEAGIPEDDPRNPATIADNVGDNVGDCAGMAADIFESYEVTLVAAIVLGAATAAIFDQSTWMKLVLFALMARGVGILASIIGIYSVRGSDNIDADPLKAIRRGFITSAVVALIGTLGLAYFMMGGRGNPVQTSQLFPLEHYQRLELDAVRAERDRLAKERNVDPTEITVSDLQGRQAIQALELDDMNELTVLQQALMPPPRGGHPPLEDLAGFQRVDFSDTNAPLTRQVAEYAVPDMAGESSMQPRFVTLSQAYAQPPKVFLIRVTRTPREGQQLGPNEQPSQEVWVGPFQEDFVQKQIAEGNKPENQREDQPVVNYEVIRSVPTAIYAHPEGHLAMGVDGEIEHPHRIAIGQQMTYFTQTATRINTLMEERQTNPEVVMPQQQTMGMALVEHALVPWYLFFLAIAFGVLMAFAIELLTDYYVGLHGRPVQEVAGVSNAGPAPMIIQGFALGAESSVFSVFAIVVALLVPLYIFSPVLYGGYLLSFYGIALVGLGLLTTTGYILAMDTFGPISDNAQGVYEMSGEGHDSPEGSKAVQRLDAAGNTTKALTKGFAIATAVVAAVALFHSYIESARLTELGLKLDVPEIFLGLLIGGAAPFLFSASTINAVGRASFQLIHEVRRQFRSDPGIMAGTSKPNYGECVAIVTRAAQQELIGPGILAIALPAAVAFGFSIGKEPVNIGGNFYNLTGAQALGGFLAGAILTGQLMAVLLANSGGIWDNAKKLIEDGLYGGKGTDAHKAGVVCDTVGDPFKDTAGPALNPLIKVMNLVALLLAPVVILPLGNTTLVLITVISVAALAFSIWWSKRGSMSSALQAAQETGEAAAESFEHPSKPELGAQVPGKQVPGKRKITVDDVEGIEKPLDEDHDRS